MRTNKNLKITLGQTKCKGKNSQSIARASPEHRQSIAGTSPEHSRNGRHNSPDKSPEHQKKSPKSPRIAKVTKNRQCQPQAGGQSRHTPRSGKRRASSRGERERNEVPAPNFIDQKRWAIKAVLGHRKKDPLPVADRPIDRHTKKPARPRRKLIEWDGWVPREACTWEEATSSELDREELENERITVHPTGGSKTFEATILKQVKGTVHSVKFPSTQEPQLITLAILQTLAHWCVCS